MHEKLGVTDFFLATTAVVGLTITHPEFFHPKGLGAFMLNAPLATAFACFPEQFNQTLVHDRTDLQHKLWYATALIGISVSTNDYVDMHKNAWTAAGKDNKKPSSNEFYKRGLTNWRNRLESSGYITGEMPTESRKKFKSFMSGVIRLNTQVQNRPDITLRQTIRMKELENAINIVHVMGLLLNNTDIPESNLDLASSKIGFSQIEERYGWIINGEPASETQRKLCALFNLIMMAQTVDDWNDRKIDAVYGISSIGVLALKESESVPAAKAEIDKLIRVYRSKAWEFGASKELAYAILGLIRLYKTLQGKIPRLFGGKREKEFASLNIAS